MPHADVNGQRIFFEDTGGDGPPVILAHGFLMDHEMFVHQVAALRDDYRVITWDERGFGQTEYGGEPFTYWDSANDCLALLDHLGIERAVVGGMSQGGFLSLRVALTAPERVRALILLDTQAGVEHFGRALAHGFRHAVVVTDPTFNGVQVALHAARLARDLGIPGLHLVVNRVRGGRDEAHVREILAGEEPVAFTSTHFLPYEELLLQSEPDVGPLLEWTASPFLAAVGGLRDALLQEERERWQRAS